MSELEASNVLPVTNAAEVLEAQQAVRRVHLSDGVREYTYRIVAATRSHPKLEEGEGQRPSCSIQKATLRR